MTNQATYDDANLIMRLYELRREEKLRQARDWFTQHFHPANMDELQRIAPPGSKENAYVRMVISYWEMAASFITSGVLNQQLFFESNGEMLVAWERLRDLVPDVRQTMKNPHAFHSLEVVGNAYAKWMQSHGPEAYPAFLSMVKAAAPATSGQTP